MAKFVNIRLPYLFSVYSETWDISASVVSGLNMFIVYQDDVKLMV